MKKKFIFLPIFTLLLFSMITGSINSTKRINTVSLITVAYAETGTTGIGEFLDKITTTEEGVGVDIDVSENEKMDIPSIFSKYRTFAAFVSGILTATAMFMLFYNVSKLSTALDNEFFRKRTITGIAVSAISVGLLGSATLILSFFYKFLQ